MSKILITETWGNINPLDRNYRYYLNGYKFIDEKTCEQVCECLRKETEVLTGNYRIYFEVVPDAHKIKNPH